VIQRHRQASLLLALALVAAPAVGLRALCVGNSCGPGPATPARIPFCSLPASLREGISAGFYDGRSPDVLAAPKEADLWGGLDGEPGIDPAWPAASGEPSMRVPLVFSGSGVKRGARVRAGTTLTAVAPTLESVLGIRWQNPGVHPGAPITGIGGGPPPRLVLEIAWKGVGSSDLAAHRSTWPILRSLLAHGAGSLRASAGSLPLDPAASLTTIGTGGLPKDHGITGLYLRNDDTTSPFAGKLTRAWGRGAPLSVISALGDDLEQASGGHAKIGVVGTDPSDRGIVGGNWYQGPDEDETSYVDPSHQAVAVERMLASGFGADAQPDLLAVVMRDSIGNMDAQTRQIVAMAERASRGRLTLAVAGTGSAIAPGSRRVPLSTALGPVDAAVPGSDPVVEGAVAGGIFLDQAVLAQADVSSNVAVEALLNDPGPDGTPLLADAFPAFAASFGKYCAQVEGGA
jgi:hypothetical protein